MPNALLIWDGDMEVLKDDIEAAQTAMKRLNEGLGGGCAGRLSFLIGVFVVIVTAFVAGRFQEYCYMWHLAVYSVVLPHQIREKYRQSQLFTFLDICWTFSFCYWLYLFLSLFLHLSTWQPSLASSRVFACLYCFAFGPQALGVVWSSDSLVFHDMSSMGVLVAHVFPMMTAWCVRWYHVSLEKWDQLFTAEELHDLPWLRVFGDAAKVYGVWLTLNTLLMLICGERLRADGQRTAYHHIMEQAHPQRATNVAQRLLGTIGDGENEIRRLLKYQLLHAVPVLLALATAALSFHWWPAAAGILVLTISTAAWNGAGWYTQHLKRVHQVITTLRFECEDDGGDYGSMSHHA